ncbi:MAG: hypothetical protein DLD55_06095 [candidate division SR1 bacterium]|nr:MAG: hypothetical protein DLD55_06095 [candidate division SR1 bacterium]
MHLFFLAFLALFFAKKAILGVGLFEKRGIVLCREYSILNFNFLVREKLFFFFCKRNHPQRFQNSV